MVAGMSNKSSSDDGGLYFIGAVILIIFFYGDPDIVDGLIKVLNK